MMVPRMFTITGKTQALKDISYALRQEEEDFLFLLNDESVSGAACQESRGRREALKIYQRIHSPQLLHTGNNDDTPENNNTETASSAAAPPESSLPEEKAITERKAPSQITVEKAPVVIRALALWHEAKLHPGCDRPIFRVQLFLSRFEEKLDFWKSDSMSNLAIF